MKGVVTLLAWGIGIISVFAQKTPYAVEVGAFATSVSKGYFKNLKNVYETVDVNQIFRYYIDVADHETARKKRQEVVEAGFANARIINWKEIFNQCDAICEYTPPERTGANLVKPITPPVPVVDVRSIESIFFDFDSYRLREKSVLELKDLAQVLKQNPSYKAELRAHTDAKGSDSYNEQLSKNRANAALKYLIKKGVKSSRIQIRTFGEGAPIAKNQLADGADTETGRQFNRRVELIILDKSGNILNIVDKIYVPDDIRD
ncbi:MAG: OmpA family protein [Aureispira sp.]|nr:OmpA family protein [Aureispira sp.]